MKRRNSGLKSVGGYSECVLNMMLGGVWCWWRVVLLRGSCAVRAVAGAIQRRSPGLVVFAAKLNQVCVVVDLAIGRWTARCIRRGRALAHPGPSEKCDHSLHVFCISNGFRLVCVCWFVRAVGSRYVWFVGVLVGLLYGLLVC